MNSQESIGIPFKFYNRLPQFYSKSTQLQQLTKKTMPFLSSIPEEALTYLSENSSLLIYNKNATIVNEGKITRSFFIIFSGKVRIFSSDNGKEITHKIVRAGTYFGETSLLTNEPLSASVVALEKTVCVVVAKEDFLNWLATYPEVTFYFLGALSGIIQDLTEKVRQLAFMSVYERIVKTLQDMAVDEGNIRVIHDRPTQQELAFMIGASREMVCKIMMDLIKGGYVTVCDDYLIIKKNIPAYW